MIYQESVETIVNQGWGDFKEIWLIKRFGDKVWNGTVEKGAIVWTEIKEGEMPEIPFLRMYGPFWQTIVDALTNKTPPTKKEALDAELVATKFHLEDMRKLVFKVK